MNSPNFTKHNINSQTCPNCGASLAVHISATGQPAPMANGWQPVTRSQFEAATASPWSAPGAAAIPDFSEYQKTQPARPATLESDFFVPLAQSLASGFLVFLPATAAGWAIGYGLGDALKFGAFLGVAVVSVVWAVRLDAHTKLLWAVESIVNRDIDSDGATGQPEPQKAAIVRVELATGPQSRIVDLPATDDQIEAIAGVVLSGGNFSRRGLKGILTESEYPILTDAMQAAGLLKPKGSGVTVTAAGRAVLRRFAAAVGGGGVRLSENTNGSGAGVGGEL